MKSRMIVATLLMMGAFTAGTALADTGTASQPRAVNFQDGANTASKPRPRHHKAAKRVKHVKHVRHHKKAK